SRKAPRRRMGGAGDMRRERGRVWREHIRPDSTAQPQRQEYGRMCGWLRPQYVPRPDLGDHSGDPVGKACCEVSLPRALRFMREVPPSLALGVPPSAKREGEALAYSTS